MSVHLKVNTNEIRVASADIERIATEIETNVASMMTRLMTLEQGWEGTASASFMEAINRWQFTQREVRTALLVIKTSLARAGEEYNTVESFATSLFRS